MIPWHQETIVVVDFETSGTDPEACMPVQIGVARFEAGELVAKRSALINPGIPIPEEASAIHGITDEMVRDAPPPDRAIIECAQGLVEDAYPCGYNAERYDRLIWERFAGSMGPWVDVIAMVRHFDKYAKGKGRYQLETVCKRWGVTLGDAHRADADAEATGQVLLCKRMINALGDMPMAELLERQAARLKEQEAEQQAFFAKLRRERADAIRLHVYAAAYAHLAVRGESAHEQAKSVADCAFEDVVSDEGWK